MSIKIALLALLASLAAGCTSIRCTSPSGEPFYRHLLGSKTAGPPRNCSPAAKGRSPNQSRQGRQKTYALVPQPCVFIHFFKNKTRFVEQLTAFVDPLYSENNNEFPKLQHAYTKL